MNNKVTKEIFNISQESKNIALLIWVGTLFFGFIPGLILYLLRKDDAYIEDQSKEALNWSITVLIATFIGSILTFILVGFLMYFVIFSINIIFCLMGVLATYNGQVFRVPFAIRLLK